MEGSLLLENKRIFAPHLDNSHWLPHDTTSGNIVLDSKPRVGKKMPFAIRGFFWEKKYGARQARNIPQPLNYRFIGKWKPRAIRQLFYRLHTCIDHGYSLSRGPRDRFLKNMGSRYFSISNLLVSLRIAIV
jgi:hypothetical protein